MDLVEAYILREAVDGRLANNQRTQFIAAYISQGYDIDTATRMVDNHIRQQRVVTGGGLDVFGVFGILFVGFWVVALTLGFAMMAWDAIF